MIIQTTQDRIDEIIEQYYKDCYFDRNRVVYQQRAVRKLYALSKGNYEYILVQLDHLASIAYAEFPHIFDGEELKQRGYNKIMTAKRNLEAFFPLNSERGK